jgi:DNA/RNA endonuclease YhcR with UshA esterase domain
MLSSRLSPRLVPLLLLLCWPPSAIQSVAAAAEDGGATATAEPASAGAIAAEDAINHLGDKVTVEFVVRGGRKLEDKEICFLNSNRDHRESGTFTAVIFRTGLARYAADGIDDPIIAFEGKTIRVSGIVEEHDGKAQIVVASPAQIEVVAAAAVSREQADR